MLPKPLPVKPPYKHQAYPKTMFNLDGIRTCVAKDAQMHASLTAEGWSETYVVPPEPAPPECPNCKTLREKFDAAWQKVVGEKERLQADLAELQKVTLSAMGADEQPAEPSESTEPKPKRGKS